MTQLHRIMVRDEIRGKPLVYLRSGAAWAKSAMKFERIAL